MPAVTWIATFGSRRVANTSCRLREAKGIELIWVDTLADQTQPKDNAGLTRLRHTTVELPLGPCSDAA